MSENGKKIIRTLTGQHFLSCLFKGQSQHTRELSPIGKKLIGKWKFRSYNPAPTDFWEFKDAIIDSLSNETITYRQYTDSVKQSLGNRAGKWYEKDSIIYGTCVPVAKIIKLTNDSLVFHHTQSGVTLEYVWTKWK